MTVAMRLNYCACFALCAFLLCKPTHAQDRREFWPEVDTYVNLSSRTRLFFITAFSGDQDTRLAPSSQCPPLFLSVSKRQTKLS